MYENKGEAIYQGLKEIRKQISKTNESNTKSYAAMVRAKPYSPSLSTPQGGPREASEEKYFTQGQMRYIMTVAAHECKLRNYDGRAYKRKIIEHFNEAGITPPPIISPSKEVIDSLWPDISQKSKREMVLVEQSKTGTLHNQEKNRDQDNNELVDGFTTPKRRKKNRQRTSSILETQLAFPNMISPLPRSPSSDMPSFTLPPPLRDQSPVLPSLTVDLDLLSGSFITLDEDLPSEQSKIVKTPAKDLSTNKEYMNHLEDGSIPSQVLVNKTIRRARNKERQAQKIQEKHIELASRNEPSQELLATQKRATRKNKEELNARSFLKEGSRHRYVSSEEEDGQGPSQTQDFNEMVKAFDKIIQLRQIYKGRKTILGRGREASYRNILLALGKKEVEIHRTAQYTEAIIKRIVENGRGRDYIKISWM